MSLNRPQIPTVSINYDANGSSTSVNHLGMRPMQERVYEHRGDQYLLIKSPPASGKSRALKYVALDKLKNQRIKQAIVIVPERSIGASFDTEMLTETGFWSDWIVKPNLNLCNAPGEEASGKIRAFIDFLASDEQILICTHATFRFAIDQVGIEALDDRLIAIDEIHHVSVNPENRLGSILTNIIDRGRAHVLAMTGSYFRGDATAVIGPEDESKFDTVTYTYYEQLNGYEYLKSLDIGYYFYTGSYVDDITKVLNVDEKTIVHIPNVNSRESTKDKNKEVESLLEAIGTWRGTDPNTGFYLIESHDGSGKIFKVADLVDDDINRRDKVIASLRDGSQKNNRDHVDIIIALGMAKEGFDWIWCEHALTVGYRASLTEIVQIIGRATRDAPDKTRARFTNFISEPDASEQIVAEAINDTLKAIAASLLMEQVLAPKFEFKAKLPTSAAIEGLDYGSGGYDPTNCNVGVDPHDGKVVVEVKGLAEPKSAEAKRICSNDINEIIVAVLQDPGTLEQGIFDPLGVPEETTELRIGKIISNLYPNLDSEDVEAVRGRAVATLNMTQIAVAPEIKSDSNGVEVNSNLALIDGVRRYAMNVRDLDIELIDSINPFGSTYSILSKSMNEETLRKVERIIALKKSNMTAEEAEALAIRAKDFYLERGYLPQINSSNAWERRMAEGANRWVQLNSRVQK